MSKITLLSYGLGNIRAFSNTLDQLRIPYSIATRPSELDGAQKIILPGVGSFDWAMKKLNDSGLRDKLDKMVLLEKIPILGVCVGMQIMATRSEEGKTLGLGWIDGEVLKIKSQGNVKCPLPHMGWAPVTSYNTTTIFKETETPMFYFLHSFCVVPEDKDVVLATAKYSQEIVAAVQKEHIFGTQFHPEKSHNWGTQLIKNYAMY